MTSILSSISGQFSKSLVLGTLLPVVLFLILGMSFAMPLFPYDWHFLQQLIALDSRTAVVFTFITIVLSGLLYSFNTTIRSFYEGYPWQYTAVGQWRMRHYQNQLRSARAFMARTLELRKELKQRDPGRYADVIEKMENERTIIGLRLNNAFPNESYLVLPTRLGNVLRSFETYPFRQYNIAGVTLWPRLRARIDKDYAAALDDAKTPLDFVINISFLSGFLSLAILVIGLLYPIPLASRRIGIMWGVEIFAFAFLSYFSYLLAINQTREWGNMFKGAFDLYRCDLLKQLGYKQIPATMAEERALWGGIFRQMKYGDPPGARLADYATVNTVSYGYLYGEPFMVGLITARGVSVPDDRGVTTITLRVRNEDGQRRQLRSVVVRDTLPDGFEYVWDSARSSSGPIVVSGSNPYYFECNDLSHDEERTLTYEIIERKKS
jgi:hypothetical protein